MKENLLLHILTGEASSEEKEEFYGHLEKDEKERELFFEVKSLWLRSSVQKTVVNRDADFEILWNTIKQQKKQTSGFTVRQILRYAAVIILLLGLGGVGGYFAGHQDPGFIDQGIQKYTAMRGSVSIVEFSDGTKVWLNSESKLTFREDHKNKKRLAELTGEAYFVVAHRDDCPLEVKAGNLIIRDLGTTFNVKAYPGDNYIETSLVEGEADILSDTGNPVLKLNPGESAMYRSDENRIILRRINDNVLSAWRDGKFVIRDQRLEDIFAELSRWYGVEFRFENDKFRNYRFTGNIKKTTTAQHVLRVLKTATDFKYRIIENVDKPDVIIVY